MEYSAQASVGVLSARTRCKALCCHFSAHNFNSVLLNHFHALTDEYIYCSNGNGLRIYGMLDELQNAENNNYY